MEGKSILKLDDCILLITTEVEKYDLTSESMMDAINEYKFKIFKAIHEEGVELTSLIFDIALQKGNSKVLKYLIDNNCPRNENIDLDKVIRDNYIRWY